MIQATVPYFTFDGEATEALDFYKKSVSSRNYANALFSRNGRILWR